MVHGVQGCAQTGLSDQPLPPSAAMLRQHCCIQFQSGLARLSLRTAAAAGAATWGSAQAASCYSERAMQSGRQSRWCHHARRQQCMRECAPVAGAEGAAGGLMTAATGAWVTCVETGGLMAALCGPVVSQKLVMTSVAALMPALVNCTVPVFPAVQRDLLCQVMAYVSRQTTRSGAE